MSRVLVPLVLLAAGLVGCAETLTPAQKRAWDAFKDCQPRAPTSRLVELRVDGGIGYEARAGDYQIMQQCLGERHGYQFR